LPNADKDVEWPILSDESWTELKELCPFLSLFKDLTLYFSSTTQCRMSDVCLDFEDLLVKIKLQYLEKEDQISSKLWYGANAAYTKLTKYYTKINSPSFAIATVLDPRYKLVVYNTTQDPVALRESAKVAINSCFEQYSHRYSQLHSEQPQQTTPQHTSKKRRMAPKEADQNELTSYLQEPVLDEDLDPLDYWREKRARFPILSKMARDYLALQPTSKDIEGTFSKGRRTIPYYRRSQTASSIRNQMLVNSGYNSGVFK
jgi:hAT family C-terminal dimerisation region/Domain of unknown function (DUF4413)